MRFPGAARLLTAPARAAFDVAVLGASAARVGVAVGRGAVETGFALTRAAGAVTVGGSVLAGAAAVQAAVAAPILVGTAAVRGVRAAEPTLRAVAGTWGPPPHVPRPRLPAVSVPRPPGIGTATTVVTAARTAATATSGAVATTARTLPEILDPLHARRRRHVWTSEDHCHVELRVPGAAVDGEFAAELRRQLDRVRGVEWASVNDVLGRALVSFDGRRLSATDVVDVVAAVERARGHDEHPFDRTRPDHPGDAEPVVAAAVQLAADLVSAATALTGRFLLVPRAPRALHALLALTDGQPRLRARLEGHLGPLGTELAFGLVRATMHGATQRPTSMVLDAGQRLLRLRELHARRAVWQQREAELHRHAPAPDDDGPGAGTGTGAGEWPPPSTRPVPLPDGPIERYADRMALGSLPFAGLVLALTRRPTKAAEALHAAVPRAARTGREVFCTLVGHRASRRGVVALDGSVWRRLDRIDTVVVDSAALGTESWTVLQALACRDDWTDGQVWSTAAALLDGEAHPGPADAGRLSLEEHPELPSTAGARVHGLYAGGRQVGFVTVGPRLDPYADALLDAVRAMDARLLVTDHAAATDLLGRADEVLTPETSLGGRVRALQEQGHGVLVVSAGDGPALAAADVGVGVLRTATAPAWGADLLCGPGLLETVQVLGVVPIARRVSERGVRYAAAGTTLAWLTTLAGPPRRRPGAARMSPLAAFDPPLAAVLSAVLGGWWAARSWERHPAPVPTEHVPWHALAPDQVERVIRRRGSGTADADADAGQAGDTGAPRDPAHLPLIGSVLPSVVKLGRVVADELKDPLTPVLAVGATASAMLGSPTDAVLVGAVMTGNALLSAVQRLRAESALGALLAEQDAPAHRERDGRVLDVAADQLRVGDVVTVADGDVVPADARLLVTVGLEVDESSLTGESLPVAKSVEATPAADLPERTCMLHQGTTVVAGSGRAVVVAVGAATVAGRTAGTVAGAAPPVGLQARLAELTRTTLPLSLLGGAAVSGFGLLRGQALRPAVAAGVAVAVAAVPEGLPLVATVAQTAVARRLSRRGAVVRSAGVSEALGRIDTICFDKTGTLTENRLRLAEVFDATGRTLDGGAADRVLATARAATPTGSDLPHETDRAVAAAAAEHGLEPSGEIVAELPFTASRGFSVGVVRALPAGPAGRADTAGSDPAASDQPRLTVKGAPEIVLQRCAGLSAADREAVLDVARELAGRGLRILAVAARPLAGSPDDTPRGEQLEDLVTDLELCGLVGLSDRLREGAEQAVRRLRAAGVRPIMITGDHPETAAAIAGQLGIDASRVATGAELARLSEDQRAETAATTSVFARVSPDQKVAVVRALRRSGAVLAMVGDGVNDAAAIRLADVGIGLGSVDSASARSVAHIVLADDDLGAVVDAVAEGRSMWRSVRDAVSILVGGNAGEIAFSLLGTALGGSSPVNTRQFLLVNLLTDAFPALAVAVTPPAAEPEDPTGGTSEDELTGHPQESLLRAGPQAGFSGELRRAVLVRAATTGTGASMAWLVGRLTGPRSRAGTMGLAALVGTQLAQTALVGRRSPLVLATALVSAAVLVAVVQLPVVSQVFGCVPLDPLAWAVVLAASVGATAGAVVLPRLAERLRNLPTPG